jgi:hypothetical protein
MWRSKAFTFEELANGFDLRKLLGVNCTLQVIHHKGDDRTFANVSAVMPLMKGAKKKPENPLRFFSFEEDMDIPDGTPEWIVKIINEAEEMTGVEPVQEPDFTPEPEDDSVPF